MLPLWEKWHWRGTLHSLKLQQYWSLTIKLFSVISEHLLGEGFYPLAEKQSVHSTAPADWATGHLLVGVLPLNREAIGVFYSPSRLGHRTLVGGGLTSQQRSNRCILQPKPTGPQDTRWWGSYLSAEKQSVYSTVPADWATGHSLVGVLPLSREAIGIFYSPSRLGNQIIKLDRNARYDIRENKIALLNMNSHLKIFNCV